MTIGSTKAVILSSSFSNKAKIKDINAAARSIITYTKLKFKNKNTNKSSNCFSTSFQNGVPIIDEKY